MTEEPQPPTLRALLELAFTKRQVSGRKLAEMAQQQGFALVSTTVNQIRSGAYKSQPSEDTLKAIAWLAGVPERAAYEAAGRRMPGKPFAEDLPPGVDNLGPKERKAAVEILRALVAQQERIAELEVDKAEDSTSENPGLRLVDDKSDEPEGFELAARKGETRERKRRRLEGEPWDHSDPDGPEDGA